MGEADKLFQEDDEILQRMLIYGQAPPDRLKNRNQSTALPNTKQLADKLVKSKSTAEELEVQVHMLQQQLQINSLPSCGNLLTSKKKDVKMRIRCIQALLQ